MQLKMSKPFNKNFVKQLLQHENQFITQIFSTTLLPTSKPDEESKLVRHNAKAMLKGKVYLHSTGETKRANTFEELHTKLEGLKNVKKLGYKDKQLKKNLKNKMKKISKKEERLKQKKLARIEQNSTEGSKIKKEDGEVPKVPRPKPVFNSEGKMVFSKFDFSEIGTKKKPPKSVKDPKKILLQLKQKKDKLKEMEQLGEIEKAQEIKEKDSWKSVLAKASGEKIKDDPDLLKRTINRKEQKKKHSVKKWESRLENVQKGIRERQDKRQDNIMKRKKDKKLNKLKKSAKMGRVIPGF
ncbi:PREDICTED: surfeit locus protein 6 homolog [Dufourea novaeangliae]|uniref:Surfeit locus protein 6 like protein n=1 Tax=Dufourea novaeangliae TaxID=178035 RepID=A0A154PA21_DUFNO|nr:PREDICTED: surfeit locus protein 6 homolog [Dufourea novaeangliae]KZC08234.1 Surfeit locus protein 6 like protein [Dufourea novaeangliae]